MKKNGFTIIEVIVAIAIIAFGVIAVSSLFPYGLKVDERSSQETVATGLGQGIMDQVLSSSYSEILVGTSAKTTYTDDQNSQFHSFQKQTSIEYVNSNLETSPTDTGLKKITVTVFWPLGTQEKSTQLTTLFTKK